MDGMLTTALTVAVETAGGRSFPVEAVDVETVKCSQLPARNVLPPPATKPQHNLGSTFLLTLAASMHKLTLTSYFYILTTAVPLMNRCPRRYLCATLPRALHVYDQPSLTFRLGPDV